MIILKGGMKLIMDEIGEIGESFIHFIGLKSHKNVLKWQIFIVGYFFHFHYSFSSSPQIHIYRSLNQQHPWILFISYSWNLSLENQSDCKLSPGDAFWHYHLT